MVVAAAKADRELDAQREAFEQLRDLVINAPSRLDAMTQQMVDLTARLEPSQQALAALHNQFADTALASVAGNVETAKQRLTFADQNITNAPRAWSRARRIGQTGLVDAVRAAESALGQARTLLDAVDSAATDINRAVATLPSAIADIQNGIKAAGDQLAQGDTAHADELSAARDAAVKAVADAQSAGTADPLGAFTRLTQADAELDRLLASVAEEREAAERLSRAFDQALFAAQSRVRAVSDFIDTRRGSIGPEARTRLAEAVRQLQAAQDKRDDQPRTRRSRTPTARRCWRRRRSRWPTADAAAPRSGPTPGGTAAPADPTWARCSAASSSATSSAAAMAAVRRRLRRRHGRRRWSSTSYGGSSRLGRRTRRRRRPLLAESRPAVSSP